MKPLTITIESEGTVLTKTVDADDKSALQELAKWMMRTLIERTGGTPRGRGTGRSIPRINPPR